MLKSPSHSAQHLFEYAQPPPQRLSRESAFVHGREGVATGPEAVGLLSGDRPEEAVNPRACGEWQGVTLAVDLWPSLKALGRSYLEETRRLLPSEEQK